MSKISNRPTELGRQLGKEIARLADTAEAEYLAKYPGARPRCSSCAFRGDTIPNGCEATLMDALKCVTEGEEFMCHMDRDEKGEPQHLCGGWIAATLSRESPPGKVPWEYSNGGDVQ